MIGRVVVLALLSFAAVGAVACGPGEVPNPSPKPGDHVERTPPDIGPWTIEEARRFKEFTLYWVGEEFQELAVTEIYRFYRPDSPRENHVTFMYGTCKLPGGIFAEGGCGPPIQITVEPYCQNTYFYREGALFRGEAKASAAREDAMYVWTGDVAVRISAWGVTGGSRAVAEALVSINGLGPTSSDDPLPAVSVTC